MANPPSYIYTVTAPVMSIVDAKEIAIDAAMETWDPEDTSHSYTVTHPKGRIIAVALASRFTTAGWTVTIIALGAQAFELRFVDPDRESNLAGI